MDKQCIFDSQKLCTNCGDCESCDMDSTKICDNCGKCLGLDAESRAVIIDSINDKESEA